MIFKKSKQKLIKKISAELIEEAHISASRLLDYCIDRKEVAFDFEKYEYTKIGREFIYILLYHIDVCLFMTQDHLLRQSTMDDLINSIMITLTSFRSINPSWPEKMDGPELVDDFINTLYLRQSQYSDCEKQKKHYEDDDLGIPFLLCQNLSLLSGMELDDPFMQKCIELTIENVKKLNIAKFVKEIFKMHLKR